MLGSFDLSFRLFDALPLLLRLTGDLFCVSCSRVLDLLECLGCKVIDSAFDIWGPVLLSAFASDSALDVKSFESSASPLSKYVSAKLVSQSMGCAFSGGCASASLGSEMADLPGETGKQVPPNAALDVNISRLAVG